MIVIEDETSGLLDLNAEMDEDLSRTEDIGTSVQTFADDHGDASGAEAGVLDLVLSEEQHFTGVEGLLDFEQAGPALAAARGQDEARAMIDEYATAEEAAIPDSEATVPPTKIEGDDPGRLAGEVVPSGIMAQPTLVGDTSTSEGPASMMPVADLRYLVDQVLKESITDNWSVEAFGTRLRFAIDCSLDNYDNLQKVKQALKDHEDKLKKLEDVDTAHDQEVSRVSQKLSYARNSFDVHSEEIRSKKVCTWKNRRQVLS